MDQQTIDTYNRMAKEYDNETIDFWNQFPQTFLNKFVELSGNTIVDVGSGPGRASLLLRRAGKEVVCVDASEAMVQMSSELGFRSILADFDRLPFEGESFDGVWSYTSLLHIPKESVHTSLRETSRVLKPSGIFCLGLIEGDSELYKENLGTGLPRWFSYYKKDEVENLCREHGFDLVYFEMFKPGSKNYLNFIFQKQ